ncbi:MAG TPA: hypothetical protein VEZ88_00755 [Steroidobacteraceae bacterium]|nr:hypothetical protein [Steroidobacteraceae bacterium]
MRKQLLVMMLALSGVACDIEDGNDKVNGSINVAAGQAADNASTVNGAIHVASSAAVKHAETVNGSITIGDQATADSAETVNGSITIGTNAHVTGDISSVNGSLTLQKGADVAGKLENVNGRFDLDAAHVGGGIRTVTGDITVGADSRVEGGITVEQPSGGFNISFSKSVPVVIIGPGATVQGPLKFEREVKLYVSDRATIGEVTGATPIKFSGDQPPKI